MLLIEQTWKKFRNANSIAGMGGAISSSLSHSAKITTHCGITPDSRLIRSCILECLFSSPPRPVRGIRSMSKLYSDFEFEDDEWRFSLRFSGLTSSQE